MIVEIKMSSMFNIIVFLHVCILLVSSKDINVEAINYDWWKTATFYQIYPRSFKDSNNNGIGDIKGIISKLDHLEDAGVTATWLSPVFKSPQVDQGYDISDYYTIDPDYGTVEVLLELIKKADDLGIKIILDLVPNHTSDEHEWFKKSVAREKGYEDFYIWMDGKEDPDNPGHVLPPNNWISSFKGSAWTWNDQRKQYYLHQFAPQQPDLNYRNQDVVVAIEDVIIYWLDQGVAGFRVDAVGHLFEDSKFLDEPLSNDPDAKNDDYEYLDHIYTTHLPETYDMVYRWRTLLDNYTETHGDYARVFMTEAYATFEEAILYYGNTNGTLGAHFSFNFDFITKLNSNSGANDLQNILIQWTEKLPESFVPNWVLGNHDNHRVGSRIGEAHIDSLNMLVSILPGVQVTYNGEEIGMLDGEVTCEQGQDPSAIKNCSTFDQISRDFERTPFHWDDTINAGFNEGTKPWLPVSEKYKTNNLAIQKGDGIISHYNIYKKLLEIRKTIPLQASLKTVVRGHQVIEVTRTVESSCPDTLEYHLLYNLNNIGETVNLFSETDFTYLVIAASIGSNYKPGFIIQPTNITLDAGNAVLLQATCSSFH